MQSSRVSFETRFFQVFFKLFRHFTANIESTRFILKTVVQATEITEDTEKDWLSHLPFAHPKGEWSMCCNRLFFLCVLCG